MKRQVYLFTNFIIKGFLGTPLVRLHMPLIIKSRLGFGIPVSEATAELPAIVKYNFKEKRHNLGRFMRARTTYGIGILPPPMLILYPLGGSLPIASFYGVPLAITNVGQYDNLNNVFDVEHCRSDSDSFPKSSMTRFNARYYWDLDNDKM